MLKNDYLFRKVHKFSKKHIKKYFSPIKFVFKIVALVTKNGLETEKTAFQIIILGVQLDIGARLLRTQLSS